jgi:hypothetical protein
MYELIANQVLGIDGYRWRDKTVPCAERAQGGEVAPV